MSVTAPRPAATARLDFVDGLRGLAALMVMLRHYYMDVYHLGLPRWSDVLGLGYLGVHLFLLLSGFCVSWAYLGKSARPFAARDFAARRASRILPAYYVTLAISVLLAGSDVPGGLGWQLLTHVTMTHNFFPDTVLALNGAFWSLALECQLYLLFPLFLWGFRRGRVALTLGVVLAVQLVYRFIAARHGVGWTDQTFVLPWGVLGRMFEFALGMLAATLVAGGSLARWPRWARAALPLATLLLFAVARAAKTRLGITHPVTDLLWSLTFLALLLAASRPATLLHRALSWGPAVKLGVISYSVYLLHATIQHGITRRALDWTGGRVHPLLLAPLVIAVTLAASYLYFRVVEQPAIDFFRRRFAARAGLKAAAAA